MLKEVPIGDVKIHPRNIRLIRSPEHIARMAKSIKRDGMEYPLKVVKGPDGKFLCWDGGYRLEAAKLAGITRVTVDIDTTKNETELIIKSFNATDKAVPLNPMEEAKTFKTLWGRMTLNKLCEAVGRGSTYIADRLELLRLIPEAQKLVLEGAMTIRPALMLSRQPKEIQIKVLKLIAAREDPKYTLWRVDYAIDKATGRRDRDRKNFPQPIKTRGSIDWPCPHCKARYKITCLEGGRHFFERVN